MNEKFNYELIDEIINEVGLNQSNIIAILQKIQEYYKYLPAEIFPYLAKKLNISATKIYGVATFYENFSLKPKGKFVIKVCDGTACHVRKSNVILDTLKEELKLCDGENTTEDMLFTLETVSCLGACGLAPVLTVNDKVYPSMTKQKVINLLKELRNENIVSDSDDVIIDKIVNKDVENKIVKKNLKLTNRDDLKRLRVNCEEYSKHQVNKILVCAGTGCISGGSLKIHDKIKELLQKSGIKVALEMGTDLHHDYEFSIKESGCHGFCEMGPLIRIEPFGFLYTKVKLEDCEEIVEKTIKKGELIERLLYKQNNKIYSKQDDIPFYHKQTRNILQHCGHIDATSIYEYLGIGGYNAFEKALFDMSDNQIVNEIVEAKLRGRGGGGFLSGKKWISVKNHNCEDKYIVCNGDEGDPGAFMDRSIMEGDPHRMIEGMLIAGIACGAKNGYIYVRAEYPTAVERLKLAIEQAEQIGILGKNILGTDFEFNMHINKGAGAFVCGEGSALTASIEGKRGMPRVKPPRTVDNGLFGKPTVLNNVETFANVTDIIMKGGEKFKQIGTENSPGTKAFALTGDIVNTGLIEVPMGTTLREIIYDIGGGMRDNSEFKAVQIGGPSGGCLTAKDLDLPLDFDSLKKAGAMIGSGGLVVLNDKTCMVELARFFMSFTQNESCGKCVPCREGTLRMLEILERIVEGKGKIGDIELLEELSDTITATALCGLGKSAALPVMSTIKNFREEYEAHIIDKICPTGNCQALKRIIINPDKCKGCSKCSRLCPVSAIDGEIKKVFIIDQNKCIKCGTCIDACSFDAISEV